MRHTLKLVTDALAVSLPAAAQTSGTLTIRANEVGSVLLTLDSAAQTTSNAETATLTSELGTLSSMQPTPTGYTLVRDTEKATLTSTIKARARKANMDSTTYTLTARLAHALPAGVVWRVNGVTLSETTETVTPAGVFGNTEPVSWEIVVDASAADSPVDNTIVFTVIPK